MLYVLYVLGHISTNHDGVEILKDPFSRVYEKIIHLAKYCDVYSVRAAAFLVLCLISSTQAGANILHDLDWISVRHDRNIYWPILEPEGFFPKNFSPARHHYNDSIPPWLDENILNVSHSNTAYFIDESGENTKESNKSSDQVALYSLIENWPF